MASWREGVLGGALVVSLGVNAWLLTRSAPATGSASTAATSGATATPAPSAPALRAATKPRAMPALGSANGPCAAVQAQLAEVEAERDKFLPPDERYARYPRDEANETKVKPFLDEVFPDAGKGRGYSVECHDRVCKITVDRKVARTDWVSAIQTTPSHGITDGMAFGSETYMILKEKPPTPNEKLEIDLGEAMNKRAKQLESCGTTHKEPGTLKVEVTLDTVTRRVSLALSGPLANSPLADCIRPLWEAAIAETVVPPDATALSWSFPITVE